MHEVLEGLDTHDLPDLPKGGPLPPPLHEELVNAPGDDVFHSEHVLPLGLIASVPATSEK